MLPRPSTHDQTALLLSSACQKDAGCSAVPLRGLPCTQTTPVAQHCTRPRRGQNLFVPPPYKDCQPLGYRKQNKTNKSLTAPDRASQVLTFYQPVLTFIISQADPLRQECWQISIVSLASLPFSGLCFPMKNETKQNETLASPKSFPTPNPQVVSFMLFWILVLFLVFCFVF